MSEKESTELRDKILKGVNIALLRLLHERKRQNRDVIICRNGRDIERVKAAELLTCPALQR